MIGVVIWSGEPDGNAVIWCEDQKDPVFYIPRENDAHTGLKPGDLVRFDLLRESGQRRAVNPLLLESRAALGLVSVLQERGQAGPQRGKAQVIAFPGPAEPPAAAVPAA